MMRVLRSAVVFALGGLVVAALYWGFLNTPESRTWLLGVSALLVVAMAVIAAATVATALLLASGETWRASLRRGAGALHFVVLTAMAAGGTVWAVTRADGWLQAHVGEISAWFIATFNWADVRWLFTAATYVSEWLRWVVIPIAALALLHALLVERFPAFARGRWIRVGWHWRMLLAATAAYVLLVRLPWTWVDWRPAALPSTWVEPAFAAVRLGAIVALTLLAAALVTTMLARQSQLR